MFAFGGATTGHAWADHEFIESHLRLDVNTLHRADALLPGAVTTWQWEGLKAYVRASHGEIFLSGDRAQSIRFGYISFLNERYVRPRFFCPACGRGAYHLHDKAGTFACRACCRYDYKSRHRLRFNPAFGRIARLRKKLGASPDPLSPLPPRPRWYMSRVYYDRIVAELARAEIAAYDDCARVRREMKRRAKLADKADERSDG
jgi:hypothetical protein